MLAQCRLWRFMASDTKATSHKEDLPEKETPESAPDRPLLDFSDAAVKKAPPHRQETRLGPPRVCGGGPANQVRLVQLAQVAARRRARDIRAVSSSVAVSNWPPIRALSIVARAVSPTRAATSTRFAAATILNPIADSGSTPIKNSLAWAELFE